MKVQSIVIFDSVKLEPVDYKIYLNGTNRVEKKFINEFVDFGRKEIIRNLKVPENEYVIELGDGRILIYVTIIENMGLAMMLSNVPELDDLPHLISKKIISDYIIYKELPKQDEILGYFKQKELLAEVESTKKILLRTISKVINRGEKIENLIEKSETLSNQSKLFYKNSHKMNYCCWIFPKPSWKK